MSEPQVASVLFVPASASPGKVAARLRQRGRTGHWLYLGRDFSRMVQWESALNPDYERIHYSAELQSLARNWRQPYLEWLARLSVKQDSLVWWTTRIVERNVMLDSLYHSICYVQIGLTHLTTSHSLVLVVVESWAVLRTLAEHSMVRGRARYVQAWREVLADLWWLYRLLRAWTGYFVKATQALRDARATRREAAGLPQRTGALRVLLHTCIEESYFGADGTARDRYFPGLVEDLRSRGYEVLIWPWLYQITRGRRAAFEWFRNRPGEYLVPEDYYTIWDSIWAAAVALQQVRLPDGPQSFEGLEITRLVREARRQQVTDSSAATFLRYYRLIERWSRLGFQFDVFLDMFENIMPEKSQIAALRRWYPGVTTIGFQHYSTLTPTILFFFTTSDEVRLAPHPEIIVCNSPHTKRQMESAGYPVTRLRLGASLRYRHLASRLPDRNPEPRTVLAVLSLDRLATRELLYKLYEAFPLDEGIRLWLKPHPLMSVSDLVELLDGRELPAHWSIAEGAIETWLHRAACALAVATTAAFELALAAVPLVVVGRETDFDLNPLADVPELGRTATSATELREQVLQRLALTPADLAALQTWAERMRRECYSPVNDETIAAYVQPRQRLLAANLPARVRGGCS